MVSGVTGAKLVFTVPCQRNGTHTLLGKCVNTGDITGERAAVLNSQKCGGLFSAQAFSISAALRQGATRSENFSIWR